MSSWFERVWCDMTHGGGTIERDDQGRINWRCAKCGRWSDHPISLEDERDVINRDIEEYQRKQ